MIDFSETGIVALFSNFVVILMAFLTAVDGYYFFKERQRFFSFLLFGVLFMVSLTTVLLTSLYALDTLSGILTGIFLVSLLMGLKFKKTVSVVWIAFVLLVIGFFVGFLSYLVSGETGQVIALLKFQKQSKNRYTLTLRYKEKTRNFSVEAEMVGFEAYQVVLKPYMHFLFGGRKFFLANVFSEEFRENYRRGEIVYHPVAGTIFDKKSLWKSLEKKKLLLPGVKGVQRVMVSVFPENGREYELRVSNQGLTLAPR